MKIDVHSHFLSEKFTRMLEKRARFPFSRVVDGLHHLYCCQGMAVRAVASMVAMDHKLADMDALGIDLALLSASIPGPELLGGKQADRTARMLNDELAEIVARHPNRFRGYATLGFGDIDETLKELDRCIGELGFVGLQVFSNIRAQPLDAPQFRAVFARMAELGRPIFVHPTAPLNRNYMGDVLPLSSLGFMVDTTLAAMRLAMAGMLEQYATAPVIIAHVGGTLPMMIPRLQGSLITHPHNGGDPVAWLRRLYLDTVAHEAGPLRWGYETVGADHLLFGTDHAFGRWAEHATAAFAGLQCSDDERELIAHGNAERLFRL